MKNKILALAMAVICLVNLSICAFADGDFSALSVSYTLTEGTDAGIADGTVTISGITATELETVTAISLYWGNASGVKLSGYDSLRNYSKADYNAQSGIVHTISGNRLLPSDAASIVAEVTHTNGTATAYATIASSEVLPSTAPKYTMFWISDIHFDYASYSPNSQHRKTLQDINSFDVADGDKFKGVVINGDLTESAAYFELNNLEKITDEEVQKKYPVYLNTGNHDVCNGHMEEFFEKYQEYFKDMAEIGYTFNRTDKWSYDTWIEGEHYIFLSTPYNGEWDNNYQGHPEQLGWLETKLAESDGKPTYVFSHQPVQESGIRMTSGSAPFKLKDVLDRHPGVITITSHVHNDFNYDSDIAAPTVVVNTDGKTSFLDTGSAGKGATGGGVDANGNAVNTNNTDAYGRYIMVYDDKVVVRARNFTDLTWASRAEYVIPLMADNGFEGTPSVEKSGTTLTAKLNGVAVDTNAYSCQWFVDGASVGTGATYTVTEGKNGSVKISSIADPTKYAWATTSEFNYVPPTVDDGEETPETPETPVITFTNDNEVIYARDVVKLTGQVDASNAGEEVMLVVSPKNNPDEIKYINECVVGTDGTYGFKFKVGTVNADDYLRAKIQGRDVTNSIISAKSDLIPNIVLDMTLDASNQPVLSISNDYSDAATVKAVIATYDSSHNLIKADIVDYNLAFGIYGEAQSYVGDVVEGAYVKTFIWDGFDDIKPLSKDVEKEIPAK